MQGASFTAFTGSLAGSRNLGAPKSSSGMRTLFQTRAVHVVYFLAALRARPLTAQRPVEIAPNAPRDSPVNFTRRCQVAEFRRNAAPLTAAARASFPAVQERFKAGLPPGHTFLVSTWLRDSAGREEHVFIAVDSIVGRGDSTQIAGRIWNPIALVHGFAFRQPYTFGLTELSDWMIARPDGTEEGNEVGKFMETYKPSKSCVGLA